MERLLRYWHTARHLRPVQVYGRILHRLTAPRPDGSPAPVRRAIDGPGWVRPAQREPSLQGPTRFRFLNEERDLADVGWIGPGPDLLWRFNQHYFDDLNARGAEARRAWHDDLVARWVRENPPGSETAWHPYPTSLRIVNWVKWSLGGGALDPAAVQSLAVQARWLSRRVEHHLLGNHLLSNAKALVFAGVFFDGAEAADWREEGLRILAREVAEQVLADGGHFELSPMYHALALEDMLDLCNLANAFGDALPREHPVMHQCRALIPRMRQWLAVMCHPDGEVAFFNDAAVGVAPAPAELDAYAGRLGFGAAPRPASPLVHLQPSGYVRVSDGTAVAFLDVARIGPDYLPAHAHADTLSFELSIFGQRVLVNAGTSRYGSDARRHAERGTAAHNTVVVDGEDSSEVWGGFRVARRARPFGLTVGEDQGCTTVQCAHDGYRRLPGRPMHRRTWRAGPGFLSIDDEVSGRHTTAESRLHLHPDVTPTLSGAEGGVARARLTLRDGRSVTAMVSGGRVMVEPAQWHPGFGVSLPTSCIVVRFERATRVELAWNTAGT